MKSRTLALSLIPALLLSVFTFTALAAPSAPTFFEDDFDSPTLDSRWYWINEDPTHWSLTASPGFMQIIAQEGGKNILVQDAPAGDYIVETRVLFEPTQNIQRAQMAFIQDDDNQLWLMRAYCDFGPPGCPGNAIYFDYMEDGAPVGSNFATVTPYTGEAHLRMVKHGRAYTAYVSDDNINWTLVGTHVTATSFAPTAIGLATQNSLGAGEIPAYFDYYWWWEQEHTYLPLIAR